MKILVTGGTGKVGGEAVKEIQKRNADIRLLVRAESNRTPKGVEVAIGDLLDPVSVQKVLHGVDKLYLLNAVAPDEFGECASRTVPGSLPGCAGQRHQADHGTSHAGRKMAAITTRPLPLHPFGLGFLDNCKYHGVRPCG
jgi:NAD(P)H-binding